MDQPLIPEKYPNELDSVCYFERAFKNRYQSLSRWPIWFKSTLEHAIRQSHGPFAIFLNHDKSSFATTFTRQILCSHSILNLMQKYKCILWPWDITYLVNKQRLIERSGIARKILVECLSRFNDADSYPLLLLLIHRNNKVVLLDIVHGNSNLDETRARLERVFDPVFEESNLTIHQTTSLSPGWVGGRTVGNIERRPSFVTCNVAYILLTIVYHDIFLFLKAFRLSRPLRTTVYPGYISFYQKTENISELIVTVEDANEWLKQQYKHNSVHHHNSIKTNQKYQIESDCTRIQSSLSKKPIVPSRSLSNSTTHEYSTHHVSTRRAGWALLLNR